MECDRSDSGEKDKGSVFGGRVNEHSKEGREEGARVVLFRTARSCVAQQQQQQELFGSRDHIISFDRRQLRSIIYPGYCGLVADHWPPYSSTMLHPPTRSEVRQA